MLPTAVADRDDWEVKVERLLVEVSRLEENDRRWRFHRLVRAAARLEARARRLAKQRPGRPSGWYALARVMFFASFAAAPRARVGALKHLHKALEIDPGHMPALLAARHAAAYAGLCFDGDRAHALRDEAVRLAEIIASRCERHPSAVALLEAEVARRPGPGDCVVPWRTPLERAAYYDWEAQLVGCKWDSLDVPPPLW